MSDKIPYEKLGLNEDSSFDEIQEARNRLTQEYASDRKQVEAIEAAYDAILMDRLRLRQEGKIKVPDRIRFAERLVEPPPEYTPPPSNQAPDWLQRFIDTPSRSDVLTKAGVFAGAGVLSFVVGPALALALGVGAGLYFLTQKERKLGRAFLLTLVGLIVGVVLGLQVGGLLAGSLQQIAIPLDNFAALVTFVILWVISSFLR